MGSVFISYRRDDSQGMVDRMYPAIKAQLPNQKVFRDIEGIRPGTNFPELLREKLADASVILVVIGPRWLEVLKQRKTEPVDYVREEVRFALESPQAVVIPVTIGGARVASEADLAEFPELIPLAHCSGTQVRLDRDFDHDIGYLVKVLADPITSESVGAILAGKYKLLHQVGEGGMGTVFVAQQTQPIHRDVAVKLIKLGMDTDDVLARFDAEKQALAVMDHPNIARVLDAGMTPLGRPFFVMEYVKGVLITQYCDEKRLSLQERLNLFISVCNAVQHAHQKGIIHRDLKPNNVLVAVVEGKPVAKVIDFGLAKALGQKLTDKTLYTALDTRIGTLEYSAPEQAAGRSFDIDTRSDIYSLGVLLYELLTGAPPFTHEELLRIGEEEMKRVIREDEPTRPSKKLSSSGDLPAIAAKRHMEPNKLTRMMQGDLDWIVMKCLEKEQARRYETANQLGQELQRYLADEPVQAGPPSARYRMKKFLRRNKGPVLAAGLVLATLLLGVIVSSFFALEKEKQLRVAEEEKHRAQLRLFNSQLYRVEMIYQIRPAKGSALLHDEDCCPIKDRDFTWGLYNRWCQRYRLNLKGHTGRVRSVAIRPDGKTLASGCGDGTIKLWDTRTGVERTTLKGHTDCVNSVSFSLDGKALASGSWDNTIKLWDAVTGQERAVLKGHTNGVYSVCFSPDGKVLASGGGDGTIKVWDAQSGQGRTTLKGHTDLVNCVSFSPNGTTLASCGGDWGKPGEIKLWDPVTGRERVTLSGFKNAVNYVSFSPDGTTLASGSSEDEIKLWDTVSGKARATIKQKGDTFSVSFSPDGKILASSHSFMIRLWDVQTGQELARFEESQWVYSVVFSPDGNTLASGSGGPQVNPGAIKLWDVVGGRESASLDGHAGDVLCVAFSPDGRTLASGGQDKTIKLWDTQSGQERATLKQHTGDVESVSFSPDGKTLASGGADGIKLWDTISGREAIPRGQIAGIHPVRFSPDGKILAYAGSGDGTVMLCDAERGLKIATLEHGNSSLLPALPLGITSLSFSGEGKTLATGSENFVKLWDTRTGVERTFLKEQKGHPVNCVVFSPDGKTLAYDLNEIIYLFDVEGGQLRATLKGHTRKISSLCYSPDGKTLASGSWDGTIKLWDAVTGQERATLKGHTNSVTSVCFSPDGKTLASACMDGAIKLWEAIFPPP